MREIVVEVRCHGCDELVARPSDADMGLFRLGVHVHDRDSCRDQASDRLAAALDARREERVFAREVRRARDYDDGVIWSDDR